MVTTAGPPTGPPSWSTLAHQLFEEELQQLAALREKQMAHTATGQATRTQVTSPDNGHHRPHHGGPQFGHLPYWLLPELVQLLAEAHDRPIAELEPIVRELVTEQQFVDTSGDPVMAQHEDQTVQVYVEVFVRVLDRLRQRTLDTGAWSSIPTTPQMFG